MMEKWNVIQFPGMKAGKGGTEAREEAVCTSETMAWLPQGCPDGCFPQMGTAANVYGIPARKGDDPE